MDLTKFKGAGRAPKTQGRNALNRLFTRVKETILPTNAERNKERMWQYKDLTIFVGVIVVIAVLEGKIKSFLEIETDDLKKMSMGAF
jgi:predicted membrane GTPase involved in stress response